MKPNRRIIHVRNNGAPWEQLHGEPAKSFSYFRLHLEAGVTRSYAETAKKTGHTRGSLMKLGQRWDWQARAIAWDSHCIEKARQAQTGQLAYEGKLAAERARALKEMEWQAASEGIELARAIIQRALARQRAQGSLADASRLLEVCSKLGRLSTGLATAKAELCGEDGDPIRIEVAESIAKVYGRKPAKVIDVEPVAPGSPAATEPPPVAQAATVANQPEVQP